MKNDFSIEYGVVDYDSIRPWSYAILDGKNSIVKISTFLNRKEMEESVTSLLLEISSK